MAALGRKVAVRRIVEAGAGAKKSIAHAMTGARVSDARALVLACHTSVTICAAANAFAAVSSQRAHVLGAVDGAHNIAVGAAVVLDLASRAVAACPEPCGWGYIANASAGDPVTHPMSTQLT